MSLVARWLAACGLSAATLVAVAAPAFAQADLPAARRPRIGVAFSGGGAKGCAHIGVLRVLEELHVPVDYAAGASMGSIVGGLYATGMSPAELEQAILGVDWADALRDKPSREQLLFRRKDDDLRYMELEWGIGRGGLVLPTGLRSGQKLNYLLRELTLPVRSVRDFDDLPIPFRAVATDIGTGEMVVLDHGDFARALRASMAIPGAFSAVELDGRLLVDGGVTNNVPVDVVRAMGAEVVIAIDIGSPLTAADEVGRSYVKILGQTIGLITRSNMAPRLATADVVITPPVSGYGTMEFAKGKEIIALGDAEARKLVDQLRPYALSEYGRWKAEHRRVPDPLPVVTAVRIEGNERVDVRLLAPQIQLKPGSTFSAAAARDDLARLYGMGDFETIDVELRPDGDGAEVVYRLREKPWGPTYLRAGLGFQSNLRGSNDLALLVGINRTQLNWLGAEWKTDMQLGSTLYLQTAFYQPLAFGNGRWFLEPAASYERRSLPLFEADHRIAVLDEQTASFRLDVGYQFGRYGEARLGVRRGTLEARNDGGQPPPDIEAQLGHRISHGGVGFSAVVDRLDNAKLPHHGGLARLTAFQSMSSLGADDEYSKVELRIAGYRTRGKNTLFAHLEGGTSPGDETLPFYDRFELGGLFSLSGFDPGEISADEFGVLRAGYYRRFTRMFHVGGFVEAARTYSEGESFLGNPLCTGTLLVIGDTVAGPLYAGFSFAEHGNRAINLLFGRIF